MSDPVAHDLVEMSRLVELISPSSFIVDGASVVVDDLSAPANALMTAIYDLLYRRPAAGPVRPYDAEASSALLARYSEANTGRGTFEPGWRLVRIEPNDSYVVTNHGVEFWARRSEVCADTGDLVPNASVRVAVPRELFELVHGYYMFFGDTPGGLAGAPGALARFYFHVTEKGAPAFVGAVSRFFNAANIPFRAKVLRSSGQFFRADSAVLYMERESVDRALPELRLVYKALDGYLRESTPMLTLEFAPGLGVADDPGPVDDSFGQNRCMLVAQGLLSSYLERPPTQQERLVGVMHAFRNAGVSVTEPHLHTATAKPYPRFLVRESAR